MADVVVTRNDDGLSLPIPLYTSTPVGSMTGKDGEEFTIVAGLNEKLVAELKEKSLNLSDGELQNNTSDRKRFGEKPYEAWYAKGRTTFALLNGAHTIAAIIWFGPDPLPELREHAVIAPRKWDTIAFRSYQPYRGKGLMKSLSAYVIDVHERLLPDRTLWLETTSGNEAAVALYHQLGFEDIGHRKNNDRLVMVHQKIG
jgi:GNAT superfamily N-acetyltransferase